MDYIKKIEEICDLVIRSKKVDTPDNQLPQTIRRQQFSDNLKFMNSELNKLLLAQANILIEQARNSNDVLTLADEKRMGQILLSKIKNFLDSAQDAFYNN